MDPLRRLAADTLRALTGPSTPLPSAPATPSAPASATPSAAASASSKPTVMPDADALVSSDCAADVRAFCEPEADVLALLHEVRAGVTPAKLEAAARGVSLCMARHADALTPRCVEALVADMLGARTAAHEGGPDDDSSVEISIHYSRHHRGAAGHPLRAGGSALSASHLSADVGHSLLWMLALPFCLLGLYVSAKEGVRFVRRRREERRIECKQQYLPVQ
jgi:hypothetical protein